MDRYSLKILVLLLILQLNLHCQMLERTPEFYTEICHPANKYEITPVFDYIKTLENTPAGLPYGSSSGSWGSSGKMWTAQQGTPIGFEITYYSRYEDKYFYIDKDFDLPFVKEMTSRCYPTGDDRSDEPVKEFIYKRDFDSNFEKFRYTYDPFGNLIFGFAPQGMIVVWMGYGGNRIELGRYQAKAITDEKRIAECKKKYINTYRLAEVRYEEARKEMNIPDASPLQWDNYRMQYEWNYNITSDNKGFRLLMVDTENFNGETMSVFRPTVLNPTIKKRAIPELITLFWETSAKERYSARLFFDWDKTNECFKTAGPKSTFNIHIDQNNSKIEIKLNDKVVALDSIRIYSDSSMRFRESYK